MHIASIEDDPAQRELIESIVTQAGHRCSVYSKGRDFIAALAKPNDFSLLLIDWELPDITGFDVLRWVRSNLGHQIPVIFVTNRTEETDLVSALHAGADDYVMKPVRRAELQARIHALLRRTTTLPVQEAPFHCVKPQNGVRLTASYALGYRLELLNEDESASK